MSTFVSEPIRFDLRELDVLPGPQEYYTFLRQALPRAERKLVLASLYLGDDILTRRLLEIVDHKLATEPHFEVCVVLDGRRGRREDTMKVLHDFPRIKECVVYVKIPRHYSPLPRRWQEAFGVMHVKGVVLDDTAILTGSNFAGSYFVDRLDRYYVFSNADIALWLAEFLKGLTLIRSDNYHEFIQEFRAIMKRKFKSRLPPTTGNASVRFMAQYGRAGVCGEEWFVRQLMSKMTPRVMASSYMTLRDGWAEFLGNCVGVTAAPASNSFARSTGLKSYIPELYDSWALRCKETFARYRQFSQQGKSFHMKGLWWENGTLLGSSNLGLRSGYRDIELSAFVTSDYNRFRKVFKKELAFIKNSPIVTPVVPRGRRGRFLTYLAHKTYLRSLL